MYKIGIVLFGIVVLTLILTLTRQVSELNIRFFVYLGEILREVGREGRRQGER